MKKREGIDFHLIAVLTAASLLALMLTGCGGTPREEGGRPGIFVSIVPQAHFVEKIGGERVDVHVMVGPGQSPATYEPTPRQMTELARARLYFRVGVPFEEVWLPRIAAASPGLEIVDTSQEGLMREAHHHDHGHDNPHIWLSPAFAKAIAGVTCYELSRRDPEGKAYYESNLKSFVDDVDRVDRQIREILTPFMGRTFLVYHPSWDFFAEEYGLKQIAIEIEGKEPSAAQLTRTVERAKRMRIKTVFVQSQFSDRSARAVAEAIGGDIVALDPLAGDYLDNLLRTAEALAESFR